MEEGRYFYGLVGDVSQKSFGPFGIGGHANEVYPIHYKDISAVVSNIPITELEPTDENALSHMDIITRIMEQTTILPTKFGTVFRNIDSVNKCLEKIYPQVKQELQKLDGKIEMGVKVTWPSDKALSHVKKTNKSIQEMEQRLESKSQGRRYLLRVKLEDLIKQEMNKQADRCSMEIFKEITKISDDSVQNRPVGDLILNGAFLISDDFIDKFKDDILQIQEKYRDLGLEFSITGPWPLFNFTSIHYE